MFRALIPLLACASAFGQKIPSGTAEILKSLDRLNTLGSVLMIAAHPDDENTALIAYYARGRNFRTGYLSLTRGEGGQNLIGGEQGDKIGIIRTQELLAARRIDGGEQFFSRMIDFGFSKNAAETIDKWNREEVLRDIVWTIRKFRPDVVVLRFSGTPRDGHGHHQTSALLGKDAFAMAGDRTKFADQLKFVEPWQPRRLYFNLFAFMPSMEAENEKTPGTLVFDTGEFDPVLGYSFNEIAGVSRSQHRSQGMGSPERKGSSRNHLLPLAGDPATKDPFDGIDTTWSRVGAPEIGRLLARARAEFQPANPAATVPALLDARKSIAARSDFWSRWKLREIDETIALCAGLWVDASAERAEVVPGAAITVAVSAIVRSSLTASIDGKPLTPNRVETSERTWILPADHPVSQPYWLRESKDGTRYRVRDFDLLGLPENPPESTMKFRVELLGGEIELHRPVHYRYVDRADGELVRPVVAVPAVAVQLSNKVMVFPSAAPRAVEVTVTAKIANAAGELRLTAPSGWRVEPASSRFSLSQVNEQTTAAFTVSPGAKAGELQAIATYNGREYSLGIDTIRYPHIPPQSLFPPATAELIPVDVKILSKKVGYVMGAGDDVPEALRDLGCTVTLLSAEDLSRGDLASFDAIVTGVRAYNTRNDLRANHRRLMQYIENGGTMIVQYNVADNRFWAGRESVGNRFGPYPIELGNGRVTDEEAAVERLIDHPLLKTPNAIAAADWQGWVQERGLYFASKWDPKYQPLFRMKDPGDQPLDGSTLVAAHGKGTYIFTTLSWFRQLPAGVPGAYRIFANFLSAGKR